MIHTVKKHRLAMIAAIVIFSAIVAVGIFTITKIQTSQAQTSGAKISLNTPVSFPVDI